MDSMYGFTQLDALTVISLSITWVFGVLAVICGLRFITKVYNPAKDFTVVNDGLVCGPITYKGGKIEEYNG